MDAWIWLVLAIISILLAYLTAKWFYEVAEEKGYQKKNISGYASC